MQMDHYLNPYASRRMPIFATNGMVATSQPLAAQAGLAILQQGGNAIDAAISAAAALTVVEPTSNGIGGDAFALVWSRGKLHGLNASGPSPQLLSLAALAKAGVSEMPTYGFMPVTVPGAPAGWAALSARFGHLPFQKLLEPAIHYATEGFPISPVLAYFWQRALSRYEQTLHGEAFRYWFETFAPSGHAPQAGDIWRSPDQARTLQVIADSEADAFYVGELATAIDQFSRRHGGYIRAEDLAGYQPEWVEPLSVHYGGYDVWELPPNGHGVIALMALNILKGFELGQRETAQSYHLQIEALKLAFSEGRKHIADASHMDISAGELLDEGYAAKLRARISDVALEPLPGVLPQAGTVYVATADREGNMVSFIQSNYMGFGSGLVVPGTGISLQNRGLNFNLEPSHPNCLAPGKKPYNTIIPGFLTHRGAAIGPFGVMGGFMQPQGHVQVVANTIDFNLNPQAALDAPRWRWVDGNVVEFERDVPQHIVENLQSKGHEVRYAINGHTFGRGQIIWRTPTGALVGATEPRTDGHISAW